MEARTSRDGWTALFPCRIARLHLARFWNYRQAVDLPGRHPTPKDDEIMAHGLVAFRARHAHRSDVQGSISEHPHRVRCDRHRHPWTGLQALPDGVRSGQHDPVTTDQDGIRRIHAHQLRRVLLVERRGVSLAYPPELIEGRAKRHSGLLNALA